MTEDYVPTSDEFRPLVLKVLADGVQLSRRDLTERVADAAGLSEAARSQRIPSGTKRYSNRINWAMSALAIGGLVRRPKRGWYAITDNGREVARRDLTSYSERDMLEWPVWQQYQAEIAERKLASHSTVPDLDDASDPVESIEALVQRYNDNTETILRQRLQEASPAFFEVAVLKLLGAMGYGGSDADRLHVGQSGDGGIDGVIKQDALGLSNVYIQAKRYSDRNNVQRPEVQAFYGAAANKRAQSAVFITTSSFSVGAQEAAENYITPRIILIDGVKLTQLMLEYGVAVQPKNSYSLFEIDEDFFEDEFGY